MYKYKSCIQNATSVTLLLYNALTSLSVADGRGGAVIHNSISDDYITFCIINLSLQSKN